MANDEVDVKVKTQKQDNASQPTQEVDSTEKQEVSNNSEDSSPRGGTAIGGTSK